MAVVLVEDFFIYFSSFARLCHILCSLEENVLGFLVHSGEASVSIWLLPSLSMECPVFSLAILEIPFLEVFFKRMTLSVNF